MRMFKAVALACCAGAPLLAAGNLAAESTDSGSLMEEIVVTAQKRAQNLQDVPIAITAFSETTIERVGGSSLADMESFAPSLNFGRGSRRTRGEINIRGVGSFSRNPGFDARAGVYVDGVFVGRSGMFDSDLQAVQGVEVLRGPQGTLFGRNTISGAVNINTIAPSEEFDAHLSADFGNFERRKFQAFVNGAISERVMGNLAITKLDQDGFIKNTFLDEDLNGIDRLSGRARLRILASDALELNFSFDFLDEDARAGNGEGIGADSGVGGAFGQASFSTAPDPFRVDHDADEIETREFWGAALTADYTFGNDYTFTSITAFRDMDWFNRNEEDYTRLFIGISEFNEDAQQFTQELRITSPQNERFDWVAGLYFIDQDISTDRNGTFTGLFFGRPGDQAEVIPTFVDVEASGWAAYVNGNYRFSEQLELTAGLRYTYDEKDITFFLPNPTGFAGVLDMTGQAPFEDKYDADDFTPKIGLNYFLNEDVMFYASYSEGFKSGGFNVDFIQSLNELPYDEETARSWEFGFKGTFADDRVRLNLALFDTNFKDFQVQQFQRISDTVSRIAISNASEATTQGVEFELTVLPVEGLTLLANGAFIDAEFDEFEECNAGVDCTGNDLPYAPEFKLYLSAQYEWELAANGGRMFARWDYSFTDQYFTHPENTRVVREVEDFQIHNARIGYSSADDRWNIAIWGKNLADKEYLRMAELNFFGVQRGSYDPPRTYGLTARVNF